MNSSLPPASSFPPKLINDRINDTILGTVVTVNEWYRNELERLQNNVRPRHCERYDELVSFIVDPKLLEPLKAHAPCPPLSPISLNSFTEEDEEEEEYEDENGHSENGEEEENGDSDMEDANDNNNIPNILTTSTTTNLSQEQTPSSPSSQTHRRLSTTLCRVFLELMRYCGRTSTTINNAPRLLLSEFDKLRQDVKSKKAINAMEFRAKLLKLLFGKIQMTEYLIKCWKFICEWVTRPPLQDHTQAMRWIEMTLSAFIAAKKLFLKERVHERQKLQEQKLQRPYY